MNRNETFREYFRRARTDPAVRAQLRKNARVSRAVFGWLLILLSLLAVGDIGYQALFEGVWISRSSFFFAVSIAVNWFIYQKFGDRLAALSATDDSLKH